MIAQMKSASRRVSLPIRLVIWLFIVPLFFAQAFNAVGIMTSLYIIFDTDNQKYHEVYSLVAAGYAVLCGFFSWRIDCLAKESQWLLWEREVTETFYKYSLYTPGSVIWYAAMALIAWMLYAFQLAIYTGTFSQFSVIFQ
jgi:hypothetical protein